MTAEKKPLSEKRKKSIRKYLQTLDEIKLRVPKGKKDTLKKHASSAGMSLNAFILSAVEEKIQHLNDTIGTKTGSGT